MNENKIIENIIEKSQMKIAISEFKEEESSMPKINKIAKSVATILVVLGLGTGIVYATTNLYEKIWKSPTYVTQEQKEEEIANIKSEITNEEKEEFITNDEANKIVISILSKLGYTNENITETNLLRGYENSVNYIIKTDTNKTITIDPKTGELYNMINNDIMNKNVNPDKIDSQKAIQIAEQTYQNLGIEFINNGYEVAKAEENDYTFGENSNKMWNIIFAKKYEDRFDMEDYYSIAFLVNSDKVYYYVVTGNIKGNFEDNPIILTKEEAIKIAEEKEKEFSNLDISSIEAELSIEKMNLFIWGLENNIDNHDGKYTIEEKSRNVWVVTVKHDTEYPIREYDMESIREKYDKKYYVDATTGEIIGGEQAEILQNKK